jgi:DNA-binding IclR family transcriptional regulator
VEQLGARCGTESVQALPKAALKLVGTHQQETTPSRRPTRALAQLARVLRKLLDEGYSMSDLGQELGMSRQVWRTV